MQLSAGCLPGLPGSYLEENPLPGSCGLADSALCSCRKEVPSLATGGTALSSLNGPVFRASNGTESVMPHLVCIFFGRVSH